VDVLIDDVLERTIVYAKVVEHDRALGGRPIGGDTLSFSFDLADQLPGLRAEAADAVGEIRVVSVSAHPELVLLVQNGANRRVGAVVCLDVQPQRAAMN